RIAQTTTYGGRNILDGSFQNQAFQVGADANQTISFGMNDISAVGLKGNYSEANAVGSTTTLSASVTAKPVVLGDTSTSVTTPFTTTGGAAYGTIPVGGETLVINGKTVALAAATSLTDAITQINNTAGIGLTASSDTGKLKFESTSAITVTGGTAASGLTAAGLANAGGVTSVVAATPGALNTKAEININGTNVAFNVGDTMQDIADAINSKTNTAGAVPGTGVKADISGEGRLVLTSSDGKAVKLGNGTGVAANGGSGGLAKLGLSSGTTEAKLDAATSISLNGTEVKFTAGSSMADIVSSINSASTGVTASVNTADGSLKLFSTKDIKIADGSAGTGLAKLGLAATPASTTAVKMESTVADLSVLTAADSQRTVQALADAIQQIDTQRSALGAVQNRFTSTVANLQSISENSTAALGRVQDTDFASEAAELTKQQTLQQASTAILSQANQLPSAVMKLLQ
ncbi:flagellin, partial [Pseudomonas fragi]|uniref:flagellin n=2 Tax=Pseudomonas TaxID=286 RepID=UPI0028E7A028